MATTKLPGDVRPVIKAIPTTYNGTRFRSRLEARWAAFFDLCDWRWSYEPQDFNGYIPDFSLRFRTPVLVEVKPVKWDDSEEEEEILQAARTKVVHSGIKGELLLLGTEIWCASEHMRSSPHHRIGMMMDVDPSTDEASAWGPAFGFICNYCGNRSFAPEDLSWHCRVKGCGGDVGRDHLNPWDADRDFRAAGSEVQWRRS